MLSRITIILAVLLIMARSPAEAVERDCKLSFFPMRCSGCDLIAAVLTCRSISCSNFRSISPVVGAAKSLDTERSLRCCAAECPAAMTALRAGSRTGFTPACFRFRVALSTAWCSAPHYPLRTIRASVRDYLCARLWIRPVFSSGCSSATTT
jgi:hypothetical protein